MNHHQQAKETDVSHQYYFAVTDKFVGGQAVHGYCSPWRSIVNSIVQRAYSAEVSMGLLLGFKLCRQVIAGKCMLALARFGFSRARLAG
jgi:hypothetical protein